MLRPFAINRAQRAIKTCARLRKANFTRPFFHRQSPFREPIASSPVRNSTSAKERPMRCTGRIGGKVGQRRSFKARGKTSLLLPISGERRGQKLFHRKGGNLSQVLAVGDEHFGVGGVLGQELAAGATRHGAAGDARHDGDGDKVPFATGEGIELGNTFGATGQTIAGALDVRATDNFARLGEQGRADFEFGIRRDRAFTRFGGGGDKFPGINFHQMAMNYGMFPFVHTIGQSFLSAPCRISPRVQRFPKPPRGTTFSYCGPQRDW